MGKATKLLKKVADGQFVELASRAREQLVQRSERRHHARSGDYFQSPQLKRHFTKHFVSAHRLPDGTLDLASALRGKSPRNFFPGFERQGEFGDFVDRRCPSERDRILTSARQVLNNCFPVFNQGEVNLGDPPNWNLDAISSAQAPESFYADINYLDPQAVGDSKIIWEPSRLQFVYDLGQAYALTDDDRYPAHFFDLLNHWNRRNRDYHGIAYCSALEFAFRANSVVWGVFFFREAASLNQQAARDLYRLLYISGRFISNHLSRYFSPNTHLLGEAYGLYLIGLMFPEFAEAEHWRLLGRRILQEELSRQVLADGLHAEASTCYHAYSLEFALSAIILDSRNGRHFSENEHIHLSRMAEALFQLQLPSGLCPNIGDQDGGRLLFLSRLQPLDYRPILQAALRFLKMREEDALHWPESFWLNEPTDSKSLTEGFKRYFLIAMRTSGVVVARSQALHAVLQSGPFGYRDCPHSHADHLHLDLSVNGEPLIVDPGTLCYTGDRKARDLMRGSVSHNGPRLSEREFYDPNDPFGWLVKPDSRIYECYASPHGSYISAGYQLKFPDGITADFQRIVLQLNDHGWMINDLVRSSISHEASWDFISPYGVEEENGVIEVSGARNSLKIRSYPRGARITVGKRLVSTDYCRAMNGNYFRVNSPSSQFVDQVFTIEAFRAGDGLAGIEEVITKSTHVRRRGDFSITHIESRASEPIGNVTTDAAFGAVFSKGQNDVHALLCSVSKFAVDGVTLFASHYKTSFVEIQFIQGKAEVYLPAETNLDSQSGKAANVTELQSLVKIEHVRDLRNSL